MRRVWSFVCIVLLVTLTYQGCNCAQRIEIPGVETTSPDSGTKVGERTTPEPPDSREPQAEGPPEQPPTDVVTPNACGRDPNVLYCLRCKRTLAPGEAIVGLHQHYLLLQTKPYDGKYIVLDLRKCTERLSVWPGPSKLTLLAADPDTAQVLLVGAEEPAPGGALKSQLGIIDLDAPESGKKFYPLPDNATLNVSRSTNRSSPRRGVIAFDLQNADGSQTPLTVHYAMDGASLEKLPIAKDFELVASPGVSYMFPEVELYPLLRRSPRALGLAVWSVKDQKLLKVLDVTGYGIPNQVYATTAYIFLLHKDTEDQTKLRLYRMNVSDGTALSLPVLGCTSLAADSQIGLLYCLANDTIHRIQIPDGHNLSPIGHSDTIRVHGYYKGKLFYATDDKPNQLKRVDLMAANPTTRDVGQPIPGSLRYTPGPYPSGDRSAKTYPGPSYRIINSLSDKGQRIGILDMARDELRLSADVFPEPAVMGRQTEFWTFLSSGYVYAMEPANPTPETSETFFVRLDTAAVFHKVQGLLTPPHPIGLQSISSAPYMVTIETRHTNVTPPVAKYTLHMAHFGRYKGIAEALPEDHELYQSPSHFVLATKDTSKPTEVTIYEIAP